MATLIGEMSLEQYKRKRDFARTPEPSGDAPANLSATGASTSATGVAAPAVGLAGGRFVVQRHRARNLHYDFRLEIDGVLVSWAVPKGPTLDSAVRRGAYKVEDHPLDYFDFEGTIPGRQYGAGDVIVWDWGRFVAEASDDAGRSVAEGELKFELYGEKLRGRFTIVRTRGGPGRHGTGPAGSPAATDHSEREEWLLIKKRDASAVPGWDAEAQPLSVKTGRTNDEVAAGVPPAAPPNAPPATHSAAPSAAWSAAADPAVPGSLPNPLRPDAPLSPADVAGVRSAPMPDFVEPMKATLTDRPFSDPAWLFELKWDGYRVQAHVRGDKAAFFTRRGQNAVAYFPELAGPPTWLAAGEAIVDGEVVALNAAGEPDFHLLQGWRANARERAGKATIARTTGPTAAASDPSDGDTGTLAYQVFDLLYVDGYSLMDVPLRDRKRLLRSVVRDGPTVRYAGHVEGEGEAFYAAVAERGLEGIVAKLRHSRYEPGRRSPAWLKIKRRHEQEFVVGGWTPRSSSESDLGALALGVYEHGVLRSVGKVGTGFDGPERSRLLELMSPLARPQSPFRPAPREAGMRWIEPRLVARVEFAEWPAGGALRAPSYKGLDLDVDPTSIGRETASPADRARRAARSIEPGDLEPGGGAEQRRAERAGTAMTGRQPPAGGVAVDAVRSAPPTPATPSPASGASDGELAALDALPAVGGKWQVGGRELKLSNLDKLIWPADSITKRDLIRYYTSIAPFAIPYLRGRALTVMRHPNGIDRPGFWQKQLPGHTPEWVARWSRESVSAEEIRDYAVVEEVATLAWMANEAAIDLHPSTYRIDAPDRPTWALIDIDPGERTSWDEVLLMARLYRAALEHLGVTGFPKVSGQRGIQVWIPIRPAYTFDQTRDWVGGVSRAVGAMVPELVSWEWEKSRRSGLARLDYTQNAWNKTLVAPYAVRPVAGGAVSAPVAWDELDDPALRPNSWTIRTIFERLAAVGDLFEPSAGLEQELPAL